MKMFDIRYRANYGHGPTQRDVAMKRDLPVRQLFKQMLKIDIETDSALHDVKRNEAIFRRRYSHLITRVEPLGRGSEYQNKELYSRAERQLALRRKSEPCPRIPSFNINDANQRQRPSSLPRIGTGGGRNKTFITSEFARRTSCSSYIANTDTRTTKPSYQNRKTVTKSAKTTGAFEDNSGDKSNALPISEERRPTGEDKPDRTQSDRKSLSAKSRETVRDNIFMDFGPTTIDKMFNALFDSESEADDKDEMKIENCSTGGNSPTGDGVGINNNGFAKTDQVSGSLMKKMLVSALRKNPQIDNSMDALRKCRYLRIADNPNDKEVQIWRI